MPDGCAANTNCASDMRPNEGVGRNGGGVESTLRRFAAILLGFRESEKILLPRILPRFPEAGGSAINI